MMMRTIVRSAAAVALLAGSLGAQLAPTAATPFETEAGRIRFRAFNRSTETASQTRRIIGPASSTCDLGANFGSCGAAGSVYGGGIHLGASGSSNFVIALGSLAVTETRDQNVQSLAGGTVTPFNAIRLIQSSDGVGTFSLSNLAICQIGGLSCSTLGTFTQTGNAAVIDQLFAGTGTLENYELRGTLAWENLDTNSGDRPMAELRFGAVNVVPEPSTYALMATGLAGLAGLARRRRHRA